MTNIAVVSHEHRLAAQADLEERLYTVLKYEDTEITKLDSDSRSLLKKKRTAAENLADSIKELSQDAHRTIDAEMRFGVGARQVAEEIEPVFHGARSYLGVDDCEFSLRRLISCIHSDARTIDAEMRFGVGARQVAEEIEPVFHGARSYLGVDDCEFSLRRLISCIHSDAMASGESPLSPKWKRSKPQSGMVAPGKWPKKLNLFSMVRARISVSTTANFRCGV